MSTVTEKFGSMVFDESVMKERLPKETFRRLIEECKERHGHGFNKTYREMTTEEFCREVLSYMTELNLIETERDTVHLRPVAGKIAGKYPEDFAAQ